MKLKHQDTQNNVKIAASDETESIWQIFTNLQELYKINILNAVFTNSTEKEGQLWNIAHMC